MISRLSPGTAWTRSSDQRGFAGLALTGFEEDSICSISSLFTAAARLEGGESGWGGAPLPTPASRGRRGC